MTVGQATLMITTPALATNAVGFNAYITVNPTSGGTAGQTGRVVQVAGTTTTLAALTFTAVEPTANTTAAVNSYQISDSGSVAAIREAGDCTTDALVRCTSALTVEQTPGSWWQDRTNHITYVRGRTSLSAVNSAVGYEPVYSNTISGIAISGDNTRVEGLRFDGWSAIYSAAGENDTNSAYNVLATMAGTDSALIKDVEAYYSTYHNVGQKGTGICTFMNLRAGKMVSLSGTNYVGYSTTGGQEVFFYQCENVGGCVKQLGLNYLAANQQGAMGGTIYGHTASGTAALLIAWRCSNQPGQYQETTGATFQNTVNWGSDIAACRAFVVEDKFRRPRAQQHRRIE